MDLSLLDSMSPAEQEEFINALLEGPSLDPPGGVFDFENNGGKHALGYGLVITGATLATLAILLRARSRFVTKQIHIEDGVLFAGFGLFVGYIAIVYQFSIFPGLFVHQWNYQFKRLPYFLFRLHVASTLYGFAIMCLKVTILCDWLRLFVANFQRNSIFWLTHVMIWLNVLFYIIGSLIEIFRCTPREKIWNPLFQGGKCPIDIHAANLPSGIVNLISDLIILALPQWVIWNLNMPRRKKIGLSLLFTIGLFACICGSIRIYYLVELLHNEDSTYFVSYIAVWDICEMTSGFLIVGIPSIPKALSSLPFSGSFHTLLRSWTRTRQSGVAENTGGSGEQRSKRLRPFVKTPSGPWEANDLDTHELVSVKSINAGETV